MSSRLVGGDIQNLLEIVVTASQTLAEPGGTMVMPLADGKHQGIFDFPACADGVDDQGGSDVRLKTDIEQVGTTVYGLPRYRFRYLTGPERFEGVMAQDVLKVMPEAVSLRDDGYYAVNYARLGTRMTRA